MTNDHDRQVNRDKLLCGLEASLQLLPTTTEDGAIFLYHASVKGLEGMLREKYLKPGEVDELALRLLQALREAHPSLHARLSGGQLLHSEAFARLMTAADEPEPDQRSRTRAALDEFRERGLRKPH